MNFLFSFPTEIISETSYVNNKFYKVIFLWETDKSIFVNVNWYYSVSEPCSCVHGEWSLLTFVPKKWGFYIGVNSQFAQFGDTHVN